MFAAAAVIIVVTVRYFRNLHSAPAGGKDVAFSNPLDVEKSKPPVDNKYVVHVNGDMEKVPIGDATESNA